MMLGLENGNPGLAASLVFASVIAGHVGKQMRQHPVIYEPWLLAHSTIDACSEQAGYAKLAFSAKILRSKISHLDLHRECATIRTPLCNQSVRWCRPIPKLANCLIIHWLKPPLAASENI
jgi:hypothetical protein